MSLEGQLERLEYAVDKLNTAVHNDDLSKAYGIATDVKWLAYQIEVALEEELGII